jgi:prolipoprotein diacylglyceryltransferase
MKIAVSDPGFFFALFYILSFAVTFVLIVLSGIKQKIPFRSVLLLLATTSLLTIIGSRLFTIPLAQWGNFLFTGSPSEFPGRSAIGGLLFGLAGLILTQKFLGTGKPIIDLYAWTAPLSLGIQKIGCFLNGCCYGRPSDLPWSIQYPVGSNAHYNHLLNGMIDENAAWSLNVHPVQLYEVLCFFTIAYIVWRSRSVWKKNFSILLFAFSLFFIFRFSIEFLRDPDSSGFNNNIILGVRVFQWYLLISGIVCSLALLVYEKFLKPVIQKHQVVVPSVNKSILYVLVYSVAVSLFYRLLTPFEQIALYMMYIPAILLTAWYVYRSLPVLKLRLAAVSFLALPLFIISRTFSPDSVPRPGVSIKDFYQKEVRSYNRIDIGTSIGNYYNSVYFNPQAGFCGTTYTSEDYKYIYRLAGAGISTITKNEKSTTTKGINFYGGTDRETNLTKGIEKTDFIIGANPYIKYDRKWIGLGAGVHVGNLRWVPTEPMDAVTFKRGTKSSPVMPQVFFRLGRRDILDLKYSYGVNSPTPFPELFQEVSLGSGFGSKTDFGIRFGTGITHYNLIPFISAEGLVSKQAGLMFRYNFWNSDYYETLYPGNNQAFRVQFGLNYRFGFKK